MDRCLLTLIGLPSPLPHTVTMTRRVHEAGAWSEACVNTRATFLTLRCKDMPCNRPQTINENKFAMPLYGVQMMLAVTITVLPTEQNKFNCIANKIERYIYTTYFHLRYGCLLLEILLHTPCPSRLLQPMVSAGCLHRLTDCSLPDAVIDV